MNVILISIDSLRADALGCYGSDWVRTPNLDRLAEEGTLFENTIVQTPHTIPSHASLLTGLYPFNHGLRKDAGFRISPGARTIFDRLKAGGYQTAAFQGNYVLGKEYGYAGWNSKGPPDPCAIRKCLDGLGDNEFFVFIHAYDLHVPYCTIVPPASPRDEAINTLLMHERRTCRRLPSSFRDRHIPGGGEDWLRRINAVVDIFVSGDREGLESVRRGYAQAVEQIDQWFGRLVSILTRLGAWEDTLIIVTADHGDCFNEHGEMNDNPHWSSVHGAFLYDNVLRVPLILRIPGGGHRSTRVSLPVESIDIVPTVYEILDIHTDTGTEDPLAPDGVSLFQAMNGRHKTHTYSETLIREHHKVCLRSSQTKLIVDHASGQRQLFDLAADPGERRDVSQERSLHAARIEAEMEHFMTAHQRGVSENAMTADETAIVAERMRGLGYID
jgi:arylsulfatase A-like enzyme